MEKITKNNTKLNLLHSNQHAPPLRLEIQPSFVEPSSPLWRLSLLLCASCSREHDGDDRWIDLVIFFCIHCWIDLIIFLHIHRWIKNKYWFIHTFISLPYHFYTFHFLYLFYSNHTIYHISHFFLISQVGCEISLSTKHCS